MEEKSGAIVGTSLRGVRTGVEYGDIKIMENQVERACKENVTIISEEEFWRIYDKN